MKKIKDMSIDEIKNLKKEDIYMELFGFSRPTYYKWKREDNLALRLIEGNFSDEDLIKFLQNKNLKFQMQTKLNTELINRIERLEQRIILLEEKNNGAK